MCDGRLSGGAAQPPSDTEIASSPLFSLNISLIRYGFRAVARAVRYEHNLILEVKYFLNERVVRVDGTLETV